MPQTTFAHTTDICPATPRRQPTLCQSGGQTIKHSDTPGLCSLSPPPQHHLVPGHPNKKKTTSTANKTSPASTNHATLRTQACEKIKIIDVAGSS